MLVVFHNRNFCISLHCHENFLTIFTESVLKDQKGPHHISTTNRNFTPTTSIRTESSFLLATSALGAHMPPVLPLILSSTPPPSGEPQKIPRSVRPRYGALGCDPSGPETALRMARSRYGALGCDRSGPETALRVQSTWAGVPTRSLTTSTARYWDGLARPIKSRSGQR